MTRELCHNCNGLGYFEVLINYSDYHFAGDEPIIDYCPCEHCGGTGIEPDSERMKEGK